jgi:hypothetical protein
MRNLREEAVMIGTLLGKAIDWGTQMFMRTEEIRKKPV